MPPLRIVQAVNVRWFNATAWYGLTLARLLQGAGHAVLTLVPAGTETHERALAMGLEVATPELNARGPLRLANAALELRRILAGFRPQVVNCHRGEAFVLFGLLKGLGYRLVRTRGDQRPPRADALNRLLHARVADAVVATNSAMARRLAGLGVPAARLATIRGGVDTTAFRFDPAGRQRMRGQWGLADDDLAVGLLGRFDPVKGHAVLAASLGMLRGRPPGRLRPVFLGLPANLGVADMRALLDRHGLEHGLVIAGRQPDMAACLSALDLGVVPSLGSEAIARAALELMACRRPVVASRVGVLPDLFAGSALVAPDDPADLAVALERICADAALRQRLLDDQEHRLAELSLEAFLGRTLEVYDRCLPGNAVKGLAAKGNLP